MNTAVRTRWGGASGAQDLGRWGWSLPWHPSASHCPLTLPAWAPVPVPAVTVADPAWGDSKDKCPAQSAAGCSCCQLWARGRERRALEGWRCDSLVSVCSRHRQRSQAERRVGPSSRRGGFAPMGCRSAARLPGAGAVPGDPPSCSTGSRAGRCTGWRVPGQLSQHGQALARLPVTCRSGVGLFTLGSHVVPAVPPVQALLPPSQVRRPCRLGTLAGSAAPPAPPPAPAP